MAQQIALVQSVNHSAWYAERDRRLTEAERKHLEAAGQPPSVLDRLYETARGIQTAASRIEVPRPLVGIAQSGALLVGAGAVLAVVLLMRR